MFFRIEADPEPESIAKTENFPKGQEIQSINVESSVMSSKAENHEPVPPSSTESNDIGRAAMSTSATPIGESLKTVTKQLLQSPTATDMVITDIRTPPKIQQQIELISPGKGEAVPVLMEEDNNSFEKSNGQNNRQPSTPSSGLSTWILLNGDFSSTPYSYSKKPFKQNERYSSTASSVFETSSKRPIKPIIDMIRNTSTTEKTKQKDEQTKVKKGSRPNLGVVKPVSNPKRTLNATTKPIIQTTTPPTLVTEGELGKPLVTLQDSKFKNKTPIIVGRIPLPSKDKDKPEIVAVSSSMRPVVTTQSSSMEALNMMTNMTRFGTPVVTFPHVPPRIKPASTINISKEQLSSNLMYNSPSTLRPFITTTTTILSRNNTSAEVVQETTTQPIVSTTPKKVKSSSQKKKKKKNKTRRNKPSKKTPSEAESKITSVDINAVSKVPGGITSRPLSTRIYNYLAREVMPNVGIGVVGLMLTAGLAGLFLYPFGGGIAARRTSYERPVISKYGVPGPGPHRPHPYSHYNGPNYNHAAVGMDNGQPEEAVLGQVLTGMNYSPYSRERPSSGAASSPIYDPNDSYNSPDVVGYAGETINPNTKYSTINVAPNTNNNIKYTKIEQPEQKHPTYTGDTQTESSSSLVNSPDNNQLSPESKFSSMSIGSESNIEERYIENESPVDRNKNYKADLSGNDFEKYSVHNSNYPTDTRVNTPESANQYTSESSAVYNPNENYNNDFISYSASVGSVYNEDTGYSEDDNKNHRSESNNPQDYQYSTDMKKESEKTSTDVKKESENETNIIDQPSFSALEGIPNYNIDNDDMYKDSSNYNMFNYRNDHGIIIEHGPRKLKIQKRSAKNNDLKNDIEELNNEVDSVLPNEDKMPIDNLINSIELSTSDEKASSGEIFESTTATTSATMDSSVSTTSRNEETMLKNKKKDNKGQNVTGTEFNVSDFQKPQQQSEEFSLLTMIRRITQFKLQLGMRLLQSTSQAFARYMGSFTQRMENVVRAINDHYRARNKDSDIPSKGAVPTKQILQQETTTDNFVKIPDIKVNDVEAINVSSQSQEISTVKVETISKESSSTSSQDLSSSTFSEVTSTNTT